MQEKFTLSLFPRTKHVSKCWSPSSTSQKNAFQHDLLARLYHEIGLSAVAAALDVLNGPAAAGAPASASTGAHQCRFPRSCAKTISRPQGATAENDWEAV